jgi:hypothetical protein
MLLRVPPASLKAITEYASMLTRKGAPMGGVVTKIKFDPAEATPKLQFTPVGFLTEVQFKESQEVAKSQIVQQIIGSRPAPAPQMDEDDAKAIAETRKEIAAEKAAEAKKEEPKTEKPKKPAPTPAAVKATDLAAKMRASLDDDDDDA